MKFKSTVLGTLFAGAMVALGFSASAQETEKTFFFNQPAASTLEHTGGFTWTSGQFYLRPVQFADPSRFQTETMTINKKYNTWLYSPAIEVPADGELTVSFKAGKTSSIMGAKLELCYGAMPIPSAMGAFGTSAIVNDDDFNRDGGNEIYPTTVFTYTISVQAGTYYLGFHNASAIEQDFTDMGGTFSINNISCSWKAAEYKEPVAITLNKTNAQLYAGETVQLNATVTPEGTEDPVTWSSNDTNIATVDANGKVTAVAKGFAMITATCGDATATCKIEVLEGENPNPTPEITLTLDRTEATIAPGETLQLNATIEPADTDQEIFWMSSEVAVATVSHEGLVTGVAEGTTRIIVFSGEASAECTVTVKKADSVEAIIADGAVADVYGIDGVAVLRDADAAAIRTLPRGLYIINGRKFILK